MVGVKKKDVFIRYINIIKDMLYMYGVVINMRTNSITD